MEAFELVLLLLAAVLLSSIIDQIVPRISSPLIQIGLGLLIALFSVSPVEIELDPNLFLVLFIAPLIFYETKELDKEGLIKNLGPIVSLAVGLVIASTLLVGFYIHWLIPTISLAAALALGGALAPTDAVAVASLSKETSIKPRQKSIIESESLLNDASGVVAFQFALAAIVTGSFSLADASISFVFTLVGGIVIGLAITYLVNFLVKKLRDLGLESTTFHVLIELFLPFIVYLVANAAGTSGIIAVVAAGLAVSITPRKLGPSISRLNIVSTSVWNVFAFALNGIVFVLLGYLLPQQMQTMWESGVTGNFVLVQEVLILSLVLYIIRFVWLYLMDTYEKWKEKRPLKTTKADLRSLLVGTLAGAKGAITLAVMMSLPLLVSTETGLEVFPNRDLLLFLASGVIIVTLLLATFIVPLLAPRKDSEIDSDDDINETIVEILHNVIEKLIADQTPENRIATQSVIKTYNDRISRIKEERDSEVEDNKELRIKALRWEQDFLLEMIENDELDYVEGYKLLNRLARTQNLITHRSDNSWVARNLMRHLLRYLKASIMHLKTLLPSEKVKEEQARELQQTQEAMEKAIKYVIKKLEEERESYQGAKENINAVIYEYQQFLTRVRNPRPSLSSLASGAQKANEITRLALNLELEEIQSMYEDERLSRAAAKRLRENVYLMQIDFEDSI